MFLTKKLLIQLDACTAGINFCERNKLFGFDLSRINEIEGDTEEEFVSWLKYEMQNEFIFDDSDNIVVKKRISARTLANYMYDERGNKTLEITVNYFKPSNVEYGRFEYDSNNNLIHYYNSLNEWVKWEYDEQCRILREYDSDGYEKKYVYDIHGHTVYELTHHYNKDIISTSKYNTQGFLISDNVEGNFNILYECDENGNIIRILHKNREEKKLVKYYPNGQLKQYGDLKIPLINK